MECCQIYTDGACRGNGQAKNRGSHAAVVYSFLDNSYDVVFVSGIENDTTNNRQELMGFLQGVWSCFKYSKELSITIYTDSAYVSNAFLLGWIDNWKRNGWLTSAKKPVANQDVFEDIDLALSQLEVQYFIRKVKGHAGIFGNELVDTCCNLVLDGHDEAFIKNTLKKLALKSGETIRFKGENI